MTIATLLTALTSLSIAPTPTQFAAKCHSICATDGTTGNYLEEAPFLCTTGYLNINVSSARHLPLQINGGKMVQTKLEQFVFADVHRPGIAIKFCYDVNGNANGEILESGGGTMEMESFT